MTNETDFIDVNSAPHAAPDEPQPTNIAPQPVSVPPHLKPSAALTANGQFFIGLAPRSGVAGEAAEMVAQVAYKDMVHARADAMNLLATVIEAELNIAYSMGYARGKKEGN